MPPGMRRFYNPNLPLSSSTPDPGTPEMDPNKIGRRRMSQGLNDQSLLNQAQSRQSAAVTPLLGPPPAPPARTAAPAPAVAAVPPPSQVPAPVGGYAQSRDGTWGPSASGSTGGPAIVTPVQAPAGTPGGVTSAPTAAGGGAVSTRHAAAAPAPAISPRVYPGPGGQLLTKEEYDKYVGVLNQNGIPGAVQRIGTENPVPGQVGTPNAANAGGAPSPAQQAAQQGQTYTPPDVYSDPTIKALLDQVTGRIQGETTSATRRMDDRSQQQANASRASLDRALAGRGVSASDPLKAKLYSDAQQSLNDQMALRDSQQQSDAIDQGIQIYSAVQNAKNVDAYRQQVANQQQQYLSDLYAKEKQNNTNNLLSYVGLIPQASGFVNGFNALKNLFGGGTTTSSQPIGSNELGFRLPSSGPSNVDLLTQLLRR